jgi:hypothetical protein
LISQKQIITRPAVHCHFNVKIKRVDFAGFVNLEYRAKPVSPANVFRSCQPGITVMEKPLRHVTRLITSAFVIFALAGASCTFGSPSYLEGKITILPETQEGQNPVLMYSACQIIIYDTQTGKLSHVINIDENGNYTTKIRPGSYVIDLYRMGSVGKTIDTPAVIQVESGRTLTFDISLDTRR